MVKQVLTRESTTGEQGSDNTLNIRLGGTGGLPVNPSGWIRTVDVLPTGADTVTSKVYQDAGNSILQSCTHSGTSIQISLEASYPRVDVGGTLSQLPKVGDIYKGTVTVTHSGGSLTSTVLDGDDAAAATDSISTTLDAPPEILTLSFADQGGGAGGPGTYPGSQTELKAGDTIRIEGTTDIAADAIQTDDFGACINQTVAFASSTSFSVLVTVADRGDSVQSLAARVSARSPTTAAFGGTRDTNQGGGSADGIDLVEVNNLYPDVEGFTGSGNGGHAFSITYPGGQGALKGVESADVDNSATDFDVIAYADPTASELTISNTSTFEDPKNVTRAGGTYNVGTDNFEITATRNANDAVTIVSGVVAIADTAATFTVTESAARLRSGGNNGTTAQDHTITITASQQLLSAPSIAEDAGGNRGTFQGGAFTGGPITWTRTLRVDETIPDEKGTFTWGSPSATNLAGIVTNAITGDATYTLGGFVARTLTFAAFQDNTDIDTEVVDFSKLTAGIFTSTSNTALKQSIGTPASVTDGYTIDATGVNPTSLIWLDTPAVNANSGGTATITDVEETV